MSRTGWSGSNFLRYAGGVVTAVPVTISGWANYNGTPGVFSAVAGLFTSTSAGNRNMIGVGIETTGAVYARTADSGGSQSALSSTVISGAGWNHFCGVFASSTSRAAYLNGAGKGTNTTSTVPSGINRTSIGASDGSSVIQNWPNTGLIAEVAMWNVALTDAEVSSLATGVSPLQIRPGSLVAYWPLIGNTSPEINLVSTATQTIQGSLSAAAHPRLIMPPRQGIVV